MDYSVQRLQFLNLAGATEDDRALIDQVLFSSNEVLEVPWCTNGTVVEENQAEREWANSSFPGDVEPRQELQTNQISTSHTDGQNGNEQCVGEEETEDGSQAEHHDPGAPHQDQIPRQGIFPGPPPTSLPHQAQMYQMVPSLSNVYVSNVTANVNVHAPYVQPIPAHYGHQMPPQQQQPPPQPVYAHGPPDGDQGTRNRRQRQKTDKKREGPFVQANEVLSPSLENHHPPQFPNIHPMQPYYIPGAPGAPVYMQPAVLPMYASPMFNPYAHSPMVYPHSNNMEPGNEEYHENVQQNFHQAAPGMVVVGCAIRQENTQERRGIDSNENYQLEEPQEQVPQEASSFKPGSENLPVCQENVESQPEPTFAPQQNGELVEKSCTKEIANSTNNHYEVKENSPECFEKSGTAAESSNQDLPREQMCFKSDVVKMPNKSNNEANVNNVGNNSLNNSSAAVWVKDKTGGLGAVPQNESSNIKVNSTSVQVVNVQESPIPVSQNNDFPLIGQTVKSARQSPGFASLDQEPKTEAPVATPASSQSVPASTGKSWASLFVKPEELSSSPMSDNRGRPLARVLPYHDSENSSCTVSGAPGVSSPNPASMGGKPERISSVKTNGPVSRDSVPNSNFLNDPYLYNLGVFLCNYELEHKIISLLPRGLTNRSNWCYVNAILQSLIACPPFYNLLKALPIRPNKKQNKQTLIMDALVDYANEFSLLPANARVGKREKSARNKEDSNVVDIATGPAFEPSGIYKILDKVRGESSFNVEGRQEDAEEFLSCLLNGLNDEMFELMKMVDANKGSLSNGNANGFLEENVDEDESEWNVMGPKNKSSVTRRAVCGKTPISDIFRGQFRSRVQRAGDQSTDTVQPFFTLQLDIEKSSSVKDALELFMGKDPLEGVTCSRTHQEVEAWTQTTLEDLPLVLILHLKCYDYKSDACSKIIKSVDFQVDLKIDNKLLSNRNKYNGKQKSYKLVAVVYHDGKEASKGHYVTDAYHVGYGCWLRYDDVVVRSVPESHVLKPRAPRVPYLLYYRRADTIGPTK